MSHKSPRQHSPYSQPLLWRRTITQREDLGVKVILVDLLILYQDISQI